MKKFYQGKRIVITGASTGIGADLALYLAQFKTKLALLARRVELLEEIKSQCEAAGAEVKIFASDVTNREQMEWIASEVISSWNGIDVVIANAGIGGLNPADNFSQDVNERFVKVNLLGLAYTLMPYVESMKAAKSGNLVGVSSLAAFRGLPNAASYSSTKAAQGVFMESIRVDLKKYGIKCSSIHPGFIKTPMTDHEEFTMPFMVPVRKSSILIAKAIKKGKGVYLYPWQMRWITYLNKRLPIKIYDFLVPRISGQKKNLDPKVF